RERWRARAKLPFIRRSIDHAAQDYGGDGDRERDAHQRSPSVKGAHGANVMNWVRVALGALCCPLVLACAGGQRVVRVYDGRVVEGTFGRQEAYAAYLKGVIAEEAGDLRTALAAYEEAAREDDEDPEPLTRIASVRCRLDPKDKGADDSVTRALK